MSVIRVIKKVYKFIWLYKWPFLLSLILSAIAALVTNIGPLSLGYLVSDVEAGGDNVGFYLWMFVLSGVGSVLLQPLSYVFSDHVLKYSIRDIRIAVFAHLHDLDFAYHTNKSSGTLISTFKRGEGAYVAFFNQANAFIVRTLFDLITMCILVVGIYPKIIIVVVVASLFNLIGMMISIKFNIRSRRLVNHFDDKVSAVTVDNMIGFDTVKYFANEKYEQKRLGDVLVHWVKAVTSYEWSFRLIEILNGGIATGGFVVLVTMAVWDLGSKVIGYGEFVMAISFGSLFFPKLFKIVFDVRELVKNFDDLRYYVSILDEKIYVQDKPKKKAVKMWRELELNGNYDIKFQDVSFRYSERTDNVLKNINLEIKPGESIALVGRSGAGKSTIAKLLMRFFDPQEGQVLIGGVNVCDITKADLRSRIGVVPQDPVLFNDTIAYNLAYGKDQFTMADIESAAKLANLYEFVMSLPDGFMTMVGERGIKLSGGQKQRLAIARMIMTNAPIILFDEATSSLDSESEKLIQSAFWDVAKSKTTIIIAHRLSTIQKADRIVVLDGGEVVEMGTHEELANLESGLYKLLWDLQTKGEIE